MEIAKSVPFRHIPALDGLRAVAVLLVMIEHSVPQIAKLVGFPLLGSFGVHMFFCLSGFLVTSILLKSRSEAKLSRVDFVPKLISFYARRALRIVPLYYFAILLGFLFSFPIVTKHIWWLLTYTTNWEIALKNKWLYGEYSHFWSLAVEWQFYMLWPLAVFNLAAINLKKACIILLFVPVIVRLVGPLVGLTRLDLYVGTITNLDSIAAGCFLALVIEEVPLLTWRVTIAGGCLLALTCAWLLIAYGYDTVYGNSKLWSLLVFDSLRNVAMYLISLTGILVIVKSPNLWLAKIMERKIMIFLGSISYGIYVYSHLLMYWLYPWVKFQVLPLGKAGPLTAMLIANFAAILLASLSYILLEKPILKIKRMFPTV